MADLSTVFAPASAHAWAGWASIDPVNGQAAALRDSRRPGRVAAETRHVLDDGRAWCDPDDVAWIETHLARIPGPLRDQIRREYARRWRRVHDAEERAAPGWGAYRARRDPGTNAWLADLVRLVPADVDITMGHTEIVDLARMLADNATVAAGRYPGLDVAEIVAHLRGVVITTRRGGDVVDRRWLPVPDVPPPGGATKQIRRSKISDEMWWRRALARRVRRGRERLALAAGLVSARRANYCSDLGLLERGEQLQRWAQFAEKHCIVDTKTGLKRALRDLVRSGAARTAELLCITAGMDKMAAERGWTWVMVTITLPGEWHPAPEFAGADHAWNGATPDLALERLLHLTTNARKNLDRGGVAHFALRVVEPHRDGCPHVHLLLYCDAGQQTRIEGIFRKQFSGPKQAQFTWSDGRASGASYVLKYLKKNLRGQDGGAADRVDAWRATWRIRAFAFWGLPHASAWRELRRLNTQPDDPVLRAAWRAARAGDFHRFWHAVTPGDGTRVRPLYTPGATRHGEGRPILIGLRRWDPRLRIDVAAVQTREPGRWVLDVDYVARRGAVGGPAVLDATVIHSSPRGAAEPAPNGHTNGDADDFWAEFDADFDPFRDLPPTPDPDLPDAGDPDWQDAPGYEPGADG